MDYIYLSNLQIKVIRKAKNKNIYLRVYPDRQIIITCPFKTSEEFLREFVNKNLLGIQNRLEYYKDLEEKNKKIDQEKIIYLWARPLKYKIEEVNNFTYQIKDEFLLINLKDKASKEELEIAFKMIYRKELEKKLGQITDHYEKIMGLKASEYRLRNMKTRWGTCNINKKRIWINTKLAAYPEICLAYVVCHELTHLYEKGHNKRFYSILQSYFPDYKKAEKILKDKLV